MMWGKNGFALPAILVPDSSAVTAVDFKALGRVEIQLSPSGRTNG